MFLINLFIKGKKIYIPIYAFINQYKLYDIGKNDLINSFLPIPSIFKINKINVIIAEYIKTSNINLKSFLALNFESIKKYPLSY